jgi:hypothetical protein
MNILNYITQKHGKRVVKLRAEKHVAIKLENYQTANIKHLEKEVLGLIEDIDIEKRTI